MVKTILMKLIIHEKNKIECIVIDGKNIKIILNKDCKLGCFNDIVKALPEYNVKTLME